MNCKNHLFGIAIALILVFVFFGCEGDIGSVSEDEYGSVEDAAVAFKVQWPDRDEDTVNLDIDGPSGAVMMAAPADLADECDARGVDKVRVGIQNSAGASLKSATFDCSAGQGKLIGIAPQSGCSVVVSGLNYNSVEIYQGRKTGVTLHVGMNHVGTIRLESLYTTQYTVTATAGTGGSVSPSSRSIDSGSTASFTVSANSGYALNTEVEGTCPTGFWSGSNYTTGAISSDCLVNFNFDREPEDTDHSLAANFVGTWSGPIDFRSDTENRMMTMTMEVSFEDGLLIGMHGFEGERDRLLVGSVSEGRWTFEIPVAEHSADHPDCRDWDVSGWAELRDDGSVMEISASGIFCGHGGGKQGEFDGVLELSQYPILAGMWSVTRTETYDETDGGLDGTDTKTVTIQQSDDFVWFTVRISEPPVDWLFSGTVSGNIVTFHMDPPGTEVMTGTIAPDGNSMSGTFEGHAPSSGDKWGGIWSATRL